jgi:hypothetical protein
MSPLLRRPAPGTPAAARSARRGRIASLTVVALAATSLGVAAASSRGSTVHEADLGDGGIWLTSDALAKFGRLNQQAGQMDAGLSADVEPGSAIDVLQDGAAVLSWSRATQQVQAIDPRTATTTSATALVPAQAAPAAGVAATTVVDLRGRTVALVEEKTGKVWAQRVSDRSGITDLSKLGSSSKPLATVGANASLAVGEDGSVHVISGAKSTVTTIAPGGEAFAAPVVTKIGLKGAGLQITALGKAWVAYDPTSDRLASAGHTDGVKAGLATDGEHAAYALLQVPGPEADAVAVATTVGVRMLALDGAPAPGGIEVQERVNRSAEVPHVAAPVVLKGCVHGAWNEPNKVFYGANCGVSNPVPTGTLENISEKAIRSGVKFRVNRGAIVLNDLDSGAAWDIDRDQQKKIDNWDALIPPPQTENDNDKKDKNLVDDAVLEQPPTAMPDNLKVRAGRTSKLHVLDNDTDVAGSVLAIDPADLSKASAEKVATSVAADGQTVDVTVPAGQKDPFTFTYIVGNGKAKSAAATVTVSVVGDEVNTAPHLRDGAKEMARAAYPVLAGRRISLPVVGDWRDEESDTVSASGDDSGTSVDGQGRVEYLAGLEPGVVSVPYSVDDGEGGSTKGSVDVEVVGPLDARPRNPVTQPDVVRGVVGKPIQIEPLGNDIPGADPGDPEAELRLAGDVQPVGNLTADTNKDTGVVTITPAAAGTFILSYAAQVGSGVAPGRIRIDVIGDPDPNAPPIAVSDAGTLRGQLPSMVDVLANDYSPRADVLVTQSVSVDSTSDWIEASIYQGRWVRLRALEPVSGAAGYARPGTVSYSVSDGTHSAKGQISVVQKAVTPITPVVRDDKAIVREGDAVTIFALDNDTMADGIPLRLDPLSVKVLDGRPQTAFASDNVIRFVPTASGLTADEHVTIEYAAYPDGDPQRAQTGRISVAVTPLPTTARPNQAPVARSFTTSVTAGDPLTITVPTSGVDPDGDTVSIRGIVGHDGGAVSLRHGRIIAIGPDTIRYEAYPTAAGTEVIDYEVADRFGELSRAFVRVGVVAPGDPQPPVAVDDTVTAAPGKTVNIPVLQNDLIARGDVVDLTLGDTEGWRVDAETRMVSTRVPEETAPLHHTVYTIDNGMFDPSRASILVRGRDGHLNPPIAKDDMAKPEPGKDTALVDVLVNDFDIDSDPGTLKIAEVLGGQGSVVQTAEGPRVSVPIKGFGYTVPYVVEDVDGAKAMALVHVPTGSRGKPYVPDTSLITMDKDSTTSVGINDFVKSPAGRTLGITAAGTLSASPAGSLTVAEDGPNGLTLTSSNGYVGPGAVTLEVTDQSAENQQEVNTAFVTIPVQIGPRVPLLRCPVSAIELYAGGLARELDIPTLCRAWLPQGMTLEDVEFTASWEKEPSDVDLLLGGTGRRTASLSASAGAPSGEGVLTIGVKGSDTTGKVAVRVIGVTKTADGTKVETPMPPPRLRPMAIAGLKEGDSQTVDVAAYLDSPLAKPECSIQAAALTSGQNVQVSTSGCKVTVTAGKAPSLTGTVSLTALDGPGRTATGSIDITLLGKPGAPTAVSAQPDREAGGRARVAWVAPAYDGGNPIRTYTVRWTGGSTGQQDCTSSPCTIEGLRNGNDYTFTVTATNAVGEGDPSAVSNVARPDTKPGPVGGVAMVSRGDGQLTISWAAPDNKGSPVSKYTVRLIAADGSSAKTVEVAAPAMQTVVGGLNNEVQYNVSAQAWNEVGAGPFGPVVTLQSAGTPPAVAAPRLTPGGLGPTADLTTVDIAWNATRPNGPPLTGYTVYKRTGGGGFAALATVSANTFTLRDQVSVNGSRYEYVVTATNGAGIESPQSNSASFTAIGQPATPSVTASTPQADKTATLVVNLGNPHSTGYTSVRWSSSAGGSGSLGCTAASCPAGGQVTIRTGQLSTVNQTFTVVANNGSQDSAGASDQAHPYGPTPTPTANGTSVSGQTVTFNWRLPTDGRPIIRVVITGDKSYDGPPITSTSINGQWDTSYSINVRAFAQDSGGSQGTLSMSARTGLPTPIINLSHGGTVSNRLDQGCDPVSPCYYPRVSIDNFLGRANCSYFANSVSAGYNDVSDSWAMNDGGTWTDTNYFGYITYPKVRVTCTSPKQSLTKTFNWKNP